ncbi:ABC transporter ATP-binding protein [Streptomyces sp. NPDC048473]|uniref:ABC transporter ATP-binding protein n=1 Tax=unclassified Streptomyces TaxID=2593676 RepID=UPI00372084DC
MTELAVAVRGLRKRYGEVTAVDGLDLGIRQGEVFKILGPNGAGKSTTVEILHGRRSHDEGTVSVLGMDPASADRRWRSRVGVAWQDESAPAELTVRETVTHFARYCPRPRDCKDVIALVGLEQKAGARIKQLPGGRRRRLDVALGVIGSPELLLLDEPTTGFDPGPADGSGRGRTRRAARAVRHPRPRPRTSSARSGWSWSPVCWRQRSCCCSAPRCTTSICRRAPSSG